jgi:hypothetical protein
VARAALLVLFVAARARGAGSAQARRQGAAAWGAPIRAQTRPAPKATATAKRYRIERPAPLSPKQRFPGA